MMTVQIRYEHLRDEFLKFSKPYVSSETLEEIKSEYSCDIGSKRKISSIKDLEKLIKVLEKCAILSYDDIQVFHYIEKKYINALILQTKLRSYEDWFEQLNSPVAYNMYLDNTQPSTNNHDQETCDRMLTSNSAEACVCGSKLNETTKKSGHYTNKVPLEAECYTNKESLLHDKESKLKQIVILKVSELLGRSWRDVCRYMDLREYQIDEIQNKYPYDLKEQGFQALDICISQYDSNWKINLLRALEKGRRKDIKEIVEKILLCR